MAFGFVMENEPFSGWNVRPKVNTDMVTSFWGRGERITAESPTAVATNSQNPLSYERHLSYFKISFQVLPKAKKKKRKALILKVS